MIGLYGISFWLPTLVKAFGVKGYLNTGLITAIPYGVAVVGMILLSRHSDRTGERRIHYTVNVLVGAAGLVLSGLFAGYPVLSIIFLSIGTLGVIGSMPLFWPVPSEFLAGTAAAAGIGVINSVGNLGGYIGPNVPVWVKSLTPDPSAALYVIAFALFLGAVLAFFSFPKAGSGTVTDRK
jgi:MFS family permease